MQRFCLLASAALLLGAASTSAIKRWTHTAASPRDRYAASARQVDRTVAALQLHAISDPPDRPDRRKLIVSAWPIPANWPSWFAIGRAGSARWHGTVAVYLGNADLLAANYDPDHPERCAVWAGSFIYGDPELIARLQAYAP